MGFKAITPDMIRALNTQFSGLFREGAESAEIFYPRLTVRAPSNSADNTYGWMAKLPKMREWLGERTVHRLTSHGYKITNKKFELTIAVSRDDFDDDNVGQYTPIAKAYGEEAAKHPDELLFDLMNSGHTAGYECFDGQYFFDTDHPVDLYDSGAGTQSNYHTGKTLSADTFFEMRGKMSNFQGENGRPLRVSPNILAVPPTLEKTAREIVEATANASGASNVARGLCQVIVVPELGGDSTKDKTWYLLDTRRAIKPFVYQVRRETEFVQKTQINDDHVLMYDEYLWAASGRYNVGFGPWFLALKAVGS